MLTAMLVGLVIPPAAASAAGLPVSDFGVNSMGGSGATTNFPLASSAGVGLVREQIDAGTDIGPLVSQLAEAHLRLYPALGLPVSHGAVVDAAQMAIFGALFAGTYGPHGSFWQHNPALPYLPVTSIEVGNEPNIDPNQPLDIVHLHYPNPADFGSVFAATRLAIKAINPGINVVVGGVLDSGATPLATAEQYLGAIVGPVDAVGFHPYLYDLQTMKSETLALRAWLNANGRGGVPIDINEFGSGPTFSPGLGAWGQTVATYTQWALCTPSLRIENVQPFDWGGFPGASSSTWYMLTGPDGQPTAFGTGYLNKVTQLTTHGCPTQTASTPTGTVANSRPSASVRRTRRRRAVRR